MTAAGGPFLAGCVLLVVAGAAKVREPAASQRALAGAGRRGLVVPVRLVQVGGVTELAIGVTALATPAPGPALALAGCYLGFAVFVTISLLRGRGAAGCGCFGEAAGDVPLGPLHAAVNLGLAFAALAVAMDGGLRAPTLERAVMSLLAAGLAWIVYLVLVPLPRLMVAVRRTAHR